MKRILFICGYKQRRGGHITVRDYFLHSIAHTGLDPYVYFMPGSDLWNDVWAPVSQERFVRRLRATKFDILFVGGNHWKHLPPELDDIKVVTTVLGVRHATQERLRRHLGRPAYRIANSSAIVDAIAPIAAGPVELIHEAVDFGMFPSGRAKVPGSVLIFGQKNPALADALAERLARDGVAVTSFNVSKPQSEFAALMATSEVFVGLPVKEEGGYRPPLEAMACGAAVVCSDAVGTRDYLKPGVTCLQPAHGDLRGHLSAVRRLLADHELRGALTRNGQAMAGEYTFLHQRELYHNFVDRHLLN